MTHIDRTNLSSRTDALREEIARFNEQRKNDYGRAPTSGAPLPLAPTGRGGDVWSDICLGMAHETISKCDI